MASLVSGGNPFWGLQMLNDSLDQRRNEQMTLAQLQEAKRRNALSEEYAMKDRARQDEEYQRQTQNRNAMSGALQPYGPMLGGMGTTDSPRPMDLQSIAQRIVQGGGDPAVAMEYIAKGQPKAEDDWQIVGDQFVPKRPGVGNAMPIPGFKQKQDKPGYSVQQDSTGHFFYIPDTPGEKPIPVGLQGKTTKERPGMSLEVGPDGTVSFSDGMTPLTKGTTAKVEQDILDLTDSVTNLNNVQSSYKKEYLQLPEKARQAVLAGKSKIGIDLTPQEQQQLTGFTTFKQGSMKFLNEEIKRLTGAAITKQEEPRLRAAMPDPENDGPEQFQQKLDNTIRDMKSAIARKNFALKKGVAFGNIPLSSMTKIINGRGAELETTLKAKGVPANKIQGEVRKMLTAEFGI